ncbi:MAG: UDP-N-acetylmuramoyl-tripeptide--D-alanyl-D-alanine ligase [Nitrosomonadales bacterium]|nr:UDP-N-acetylmuramoyl-tripeptide--D-alanyl-D-alanine ligase [Nitrosomonadales bacterium]
MMLLSQAAQVLSGKLIGSDVEFSAVSTDSRKIAAGDLFIALKGENFDGSAFVAGAASDGAVAALVNAASYSGGTSPCPLLLVDDTRLALGQLAAYWRAQFPIPVVALTGSNGKTTVKEMLASILRVAAGNPDAVLATEGNLNNDIGMPLTLLKLRAAHRYAVIEMGMNHPGEIDYLTRIACPDVAIVNNASGAHLAGLGTVEAVALAKGEIFAGLKGEGVAVINADDDFAPLWRGYAATYQVMDFALEHAAAVRGNGQAAAEGTQMSVNTPAGDFVVRLQVPGMHNARNALAASAAAVALNIPLPAIAAGLEKFDGVAGRMQRKSARCGALLIDDSYNANPASMRAALAVLAQMSGKRIFVMGDMGELGVDAARFHAEIGADAKRLGIQRLLALGELSREAVRACGADAQHFEHIEDLLAELDREMGAGSTVLVKGSRFMRMERVVAHCCAQEEEACCSH